MEVLAIVYCNFLKEVRLGGWGQSRNCVRYYDDQHGLPTLTTDLKERNSTGYKDKTETP